MLGSAASVSDANTVLNTAVAESLRLFADELENANDFETALHALIKKEITAHKRIVFNGNGYDDKWLAEAEKRGLLNLKTTPDALPYFIAEKNIQLFTTHKVYTEKEMFSRYEIILENYCKLIAIEGKTMVDMALKDILPAVSEYTQTLANTVLSKKTVCKKINCVYETDTLNKISLLQERANDSANTLQQILKEAETIHDATTLALYFKDQVLCKMQELRSACDELETLVSAKYWPFPTYGELLFGI